MVNEYYKGASYEIVKQGGTPMPQYLQNNPKKYVLIRAGELPNGNHSNGAVPNGNNGHVRADGYHTKLNGENINNSTIDNYGKRREIKWVSTFTAEKKK